MTEELSNAKEEPEAASANLQEKSAAAAAERARLVAVLSAMGDVVIAVDDRGEVVLANAAYDAMLVKLGGSLIPTDEYGFPIPEEESPFMRASRGEDFRQDFTARGPDGTRYWFDAIGGPLGQDDADAGVVVIRDITDRSVRRLQEEFLQWAGHELRTPLAALQSFLQLAARSANEAQIQPLNEHLRAALNQTRRLATLIDELLDASRLRSGRILLRTELVELDSLVRHIVNVAQVLAKGQTIGIETDAEPLMVAGDSSRLEQVLLNLLLNAVIHAPGTERIDLRLERVGNRGIVSVRDSGPGIPRDQQEGIFERFSQLDDVARPSTSGLGLGLYIAREIVHAHRGSIEVESTPGQGSTFTISLPLIPTSNC